MELLRLSRPLKLELVRFPRPLKWLSLDANEARSVSLKLNVVLTIKAMGEKVESQRMEIGVVVIVFVSFICVKCKRCRINY